MPSLAESIAEEVREIWKHVLDNRKEDDPWILVWAEIPCPPSLRIGDIPLMRDCRSIELKPGNPSKLIFIRESDERLKDADK